MLLTGLFACAACGQPQSSAYIVGCTNNTAGMLMNYAIGQSGQASLSAQATEGLSAYLMVDCCSSKSTWSLSTGELAAAILCPDAAAAFLAETEGYLLAGPLTYHTEVIAYRDTIPAGGRIGYMNGQERQKLALAERYGAEAEYLPVLATSLAYALHVGEVEAAVMDITTAITLDYDFILLEDETPTAVLVVSQAFYTSAEYQALLSAWENSTAAVEEYEPFIEAMKFLFSEELGRKEYEKWLSAEKKYPAPEEMARPGKVREDGSASTNSTF